MKKIALALIAASALTLTGCGVQDADVVSKNLSTDSDNFKILRRVVFVNGITDKYILSVEGYCSIYADAASRQLEVTCDTGGGGYKKHFFGLGDNQIYFVEQMDAANVSKDHYKVTFKPESILPTIEMR